MSVRITSSGFIHKIKWFCLVIKLLNAIQTMVCVCVDYVIVS